MAEFNNDGSNKENNMMEAKSEENAQFSLRNPDASLIKRCKLKASLAEKRTRYQCKECGKQMINQSSLNAHIRSSHEGIKYPCGLCQHEATSKGNLARHRRAVHDGKKYR